MNSRLPPLNALRAFEATARHMSFTRAAEELHVTPAALSHQVKTLEAHLGVSLFRRLNRAIELTDAGQACYPGVRAAFQQMQEAVDKVVPPAADRTLVISCGPAFAAKWLAPRLYRFMEQYPDIDARVAPNLRYSDFDADGIDVAIRFGPPGREKGLYEQHLVDDTMLPLCSPRLLEMDALRAPSDLLNYTLIHDDALRHIRDMPVWARWFEAAGVDGDDRPGRGMHFNHADHALEAAVEGTGVVLGRKVLAARDLRLGQLVIPFPLEMPTGRAFSFVCPEEALSREKVVAFRDWIMHEMDGFREELGAVSGSA